MFLIISVVLCSGFINSCPAFTIASVKTIAVVVPSPAVLAVLSAASFIIWTARFSIGSSNIIARATVTPSFVIVIPDVWFEDSNNTVLPKGPNVLLTVLDIEVIPDINLDLPSSSKLNDFAV